jgi:hypothetical protein
MEHGWSGNYVVRERREWGGGPIHGHAATRREALRLARELTGERDDRESLARMEANERHAEAARLATLWIARPTQGYAIWSTDGPVWIEDLGEEEGFCQRWTPIPTAEESREARLVALGYELPSAEQRAQNVREITDHLLHGSGKRGES